MFDSRRAHRQVRIEPFPGSQPGVATGKTSCGKLRTAPRTCLAFLGVRTVERLLVRSILVFLCLLLGIPTLTAGAAGLVLVGPDDIIETPAVLANPGGEHLIATDHGLFGIRNAIVTVTATVDHGTVMVATLHPIDADDYLDGITHARITTFQLPELAVTPGTPSTATRPIGPRELDVLTSTVTGPGTQRLAFTADPDQPSRVIIHTDTDVPVRVAIGLRFDGFHRLAILTTVAGGTLIAGGIVLALTRRRRPPQPPAEPVSPLPVTVATSSPSTQIRVVQRILAASLAVIMVASTSACSLLPTLPEAAAAAAPGGLARPALRNDQLAKVFGDWTAKEHASLIAVLGKDHDTKEVPTWATDAWITSIEFDVAYDKVAKQSVNFTPRPYTPVSLYAPLATRYPMYALVSYSMPKLDKNDATFSVELLIRDHSYGPWRSAARYFPQDDMPAALPPGAESTATEADLAAVVAAVNPVRGYLSGQPAPTVVPDPVAGRIRQDLQDCRRPKWVCVRTITEHAFPGHLAVHAIRVAGGVLGTVSLSMQDVSRYDPPFGCVHWIDKSLATVLKQEGDCRSHLERLHYLNVLVFLGEDGRITILNPAEFDRLR